MPTFTIYEVQAVSHTQRFTHEVEAATEAEALEIVRSGGSNAIDHGEQGEWDYGASGFAVRARSGDIHDYDAWDEATRNLVETD